MNSFDYYLNENLANILLAQQNRSSIFSNRKTTCIWPKTYRLVHGLRPIGLYMA